MARMTKRQKEGKKISKKRAARKWRQTALRRLIFISIVVASVVAAGSGWWLWQSGEIGKQYENAVNRLLEQTKKVGFVINHIYLAGREKTPREEVERAIGVTVGDAMLMASPREIRERLEALPQIKYAQVERVLPDRLHISIAERQPIALWQYQGKLQLIDYDGVVLGDENIADYRYLPLVVGEDAPEHTAELLQVLAQDPELVKRVDAAIRVGGRRWNVRLDNGVEVKLPAENAAAAWRHLAEMQSQENLLQRNIISIDLRINKHMYIKLPPDTTTPRDENKNKNNYKKETRA